MTNRQFAMQEGHLDKEWDRQQLIHLAAEQSSGVTWRKADNEKPLLQGVVKSARINGDWHWHFAEAKARVDSEVSFEVPAGLTFGLIFEGDLALELGADKYSLKAEQPLAFCFANSEPMQVKRHFKAGSLVHKFTLCISRAWLSGMGLDFFMSIGASRLQAFQASTTVIAAVNSLVYSPETESVQQKLQQMSHVTTLLTAAGSELQALGAISKPIASQMTQSSEQRLLDCVRAIVQSENIHLEDIRVEDLAHSLGISASGIQRIAKKCFGQSLLKYIRQEKLANALCAIKERKFSIGEAAFLAGYKQTSNFSLAFRKAYGYSPGEVLTGPKNGGG